MIVICGRTCSGKDTFGKALEKDFGFQRNISYTTRPPRLGEVDGKDYYFLTDDHFDDLEKMGFFAETAKYPQENGDIWKYGTAYAMYKGDEKCYTILNPDGIRQLVEHDLDFQIIYLSISDEAILRERYISRGGTEEKFEIRIRQDRKDFHGFGIDTDYIKKWRKSNEKKLSFSIFVTYSRLSIARLLKKWGYIEDKDKENYAKRTRADMWEEICNLKKGLKSALNDYASAKSKIENLETLLANKDVKITNLESELSARVKDLNYELSQKGKVNKEPTKLLFSDLRAVMASNIEAINIYDKTFDNYVLSISRDAFSRYLTNKTIATIGSFEVLKFRPDFEKNTNKVYLDIILDIPF